MKAVRDARGENWGEWTVQHYSFAARVAHIIALDSSRRGVCSLSFEIEVRRRAAALRGVQALLHPFHALVYCC